MITGWCLAGSLGLGAGQAEGGHGEVTTLVSATGKQSDPSAILKNATTRPKVVRPALHSVYAHTTSQI